FWSKWFAPRAKSIPASQVLQDASPTETTTDPTGPLATDQRTPAELQGNTTTFRAEATTWFPSTYLVKYNQRTIGVYDNQPSGRKLIYLGRQRRLEFRRVSGVSTGFELVDSGTGNILGIARKCAGAVAAFDLTLASSRAGKLMRVKWNEP